MYKYFFKSSQLFWITTAQAQTPCDSTRFNDTLLDKLIRYWDLTGKKSMAKKRLLDTRLRFTGKLLANFEK
jgi:hypothetical protein